MNKKTSQLIIQHKSYVGLVHTRKRKYTLTQFGQNKN